MADRPEVETASGPLTTLAVVGLAQNMLGGLARVPFKRPWSGPAGLLDNVGQAVTRQSIRAFMGYSMGLPIEEFRSMEKILDQICRVVMPPFVELTDGVELTQDTIGGVPGLWCRAKASTDAYVDEDEEKQEIGATILYLHGGGYIGTSPIMYSAFASSLVRITGFEVFIADYRMAPEFPFPAGVLDAADVYQALLGRGVTPRTHHRGRGGFRGGRWARSVARGASALEGTAQARCARVVLPPRDRPRPRPPVDHRERPVRRAAVEHPGDALPPRSAAERRTRVGDQRRPGSGVVPTDLRLLGWRRDVPRRDP